MDDGGLLPDFVPDAGYLAETLSLGFVNADADPCLVNEGCLSGPGMRRVLRFGTMIHNRGPVDAVLGQPPAEISPNNPAYWHYDTCHQHWHFTAYAAYTLLKADQQTVKLIGSKTGFCLEDFHCPTRSMKKYHCDNQGITAGCADVYDDTLPCQWIDVTEIWEREREVFDGRRREVFWLKVAVNGQGVFPEREVGNNVVMVKVDFAAIGEYQGEE
ncbi:Lysyl oxidase [Chytridium lagenaria]|nr:Lysyl oxidase [Chytridium lagenaria]